MNKIGEKWMAADLYEKCLICEGKGRIPQGRHNEGFETCPECEGVGFMLIGMTVGELEKLQAKVDAIDKASKTAKAEERNQSK